MWTTSSARLETPDPSLGASSRTGTKGWFNDGFMKLGRYSVSLQRRLEKHSVGSNTQFFGNAALNVKLLSKAQ
jgi:hypothetical protein